MYPLLAWVSTIIVGAIYIPAINLHEPIEAVAPSYDNAYDEYDRYTVGDGVQWLSDTAWIHAPGRVVLAGHTPGVFDNLHLLAVGDQVVIYDANRVLVYVVTGVFKADAHEKEWMREASDYRLLIITCDGDRRLLIEAKPDGTH